MSSNILLLFIQSTNEDLYVNIISHCVLEFKVTDIYFVANKELPGKQTEVTKPIRAIKFKLEKLAAEQPVYKQPLDLFPAFAQNERLIRVNFVQPEELITTIKKNFTDLNNVIVDVSGCNKRLSSDIISSFILAGISHICCFELEDEVYSQEWRDSGKSRLFHDLKDKDGVSYYTYVDFSKPGTTIKSFNRMRLQGRMISVLLLLNLISGAAIVIFIGQQQSSYSIFFGLFTVFSTALGLFNDAFGLRDRFK
jgi:hypothetical protein